MLVRARRPFTAYRPADCSFITADDAGQEISDPVAARYLIETGCRDIEPVDDEAAELVASLAPAAEPTVVDPPQPVNNPVDAPETAPEATPEAAPDVALEATPEAAPEVAADPAPETFDPGVHTVDEVIEYAAANPDQRTAVLALEQSDTGKQRVTILKALGV